MKRLKEPKKKKKKKKKRKESKLLHVVLKIDFKKKKFYFGL